LRLSFKIKKMPNLQITISDGPKPTIKIFELNGEMDESSIEPLKNEVDAVIADENVKKLIFDLKNLEFINSKGIGYLVYAHTHVSKLQKEIILTNAKEAVMDVISLVGLTTIIRYFDTLDEAFLHL